jgi:hypothetical protein
MSVERSWVQLRPKGATPSGTDDLFAFAQMLGQRVPFTFIRFSDGESEILNNRRLEIAGGKTDFRGRTFRNSFPDWDAKTFLPVVHHEIRSDLVGAATENKASLFKGILTRSNSRLRERFFMERLNGLSTENLTFTDLLINENYRQFRDELLPVAIESAQQVVIIANHRANPTGLLAGCTHLPVPDNAFLSWNQSLDTILHRLSEIRAGGLVLSSASSLTNVIGTKLVDIRPDLTFLDVGTAINPLIGFGDADRQYLKFSQQPASHRSRKPRDFRMKW